MYDYFCNLVVNDMKVGCIFSVLLFVVYFYTLRHWSKWSYLIRSCQILFLIDLYPLFVNWVVSRLTELCEFLQFTTRLQFLFIFHLVFRCFFYFFAYQNNYYFCQIIILFYYLSPIDSCSFNLKQSKMNTIYSDVYIFWTSY